MINEFRRYTKTSIAPKKLNVAVMGCTGIVGQQFVRMLDGHPFLETTSLCSSDRSTGKKYCEATDWTIGGRLPETAKNIKITEPDMDILSGQGVKIVFSALPSGVAQKIEPQLVKKGFYVFSNASALRMDASVPIVIPEVNPDHLNLIRAQRSQNEGFIVTNSNCTTAGLVMALRPLLGFGIESVNVATYQALSGAGKNSISALDILDNIIPFIQNEEEKMERETKKILGKLKGDHIKDSSIEVVASCCRVPTRDGHLENVVAELKEDVGLPDVLKAFQNFKGVPQKLNLPTAPQNPLIVCELEDRPQPFLDRDAGSPQRARGMSVTVGRMRRKNNKLIFFLLVHNTIRGAAGTCILNAELAVTTKLIS